MILCRVTLNLLGLPMSEQLPPFFIHALSKHPPDISDNHAAIHSLVLQIAIRQTLHSQDTSFPQ